MIRLSLGRALTIAATLALSCRAKQPMSPNVAAVPAVAPSSQRPTRSPTRSPGSSPASNEPPSTISAKRTTPNQQSTSTSREPTPTPEPPHDPLLDPVLAKSCGPAAANPYGYEVPWAKADAACRLCESAPVPLAVCERARKGQPLTESVLRLPNGRAVRLRGSLGFFPLMGTRIGGHCACKNTCWGFVRLRPANTVWLGAAWTEPTILLGLATEGKKLLPKEMIDPHLSSEGPLACTGDDASLCCPFELSHKSLKAEVVVSGVLTSAMIDEQPVKLLNIVDICRVPD